LKKWAIQSGDDSMGGATTTI